MDQKSFQNLPEWLQSNVFYQAELSNDSNDSSGGFDKEITEVHPLDANLISSEKVNGKHVLMLDLDQPSVSYDSSTPGHQHVYIDANLTLDELKEIVDVLAKYGILQQGIKKRLDISASLMLRPPGVKKHTDSTKDLVNTEIAVKQITDLAQWNSYLTSNKGLFEVIGYYEPSDFEKINSVTIRFPMEQLENVVKVLAVRLGLNKDNLFVTLAEDLFTLQKKISVSYQNELLAEGYVMESHNVTSLLFRRNSYTGNPSWQDICQAVIK